MYEKRGAGKFLQRDGFGQRNVRDYQDRIFDFAFTYRFIQRHTPGSVFFHKFLFQYRAVSHYPDEDRSGTQLNSIDGVPA
jgi:hypothetical protein